MKRLLLGAALSMFAFGAQARCGVMGAFQDVKRNPKIHLSAPTITTPENIASLEKQHLYDVTGQGLLPFGYANKFWLETKAKLRPSDEYYFAETLDKEHEFWSIDFLFVRSGCVIDRMNLGIT